MTRSGQRIGDAATALGIATHVLRHWEDVGLLLPSRLSSGHRVYDEQTIGQARMIQICQRAGLSLAEIRALGMEDRARRIAIIEDKRAQLADRVAEIGLADAFLAHIGTCTHDVISECPECAAVIGTPPTSVHSPAVTAAQCTEIATRCGRAPGGSAAPARRSNCPTARRGRRRR